MQQGKMQVQVTNGLAFQAQRKVKTPPPGSEAARLSAKSKVQALRKFELIRMTKEGMSAEDICQNLTARGMELKKGVATVLRLQSAWGLAHDEKRWLGNFRHQCHKKAKAQQLEAFTEISKELGIQDLEAWLRDKMSEEPARQARHELALKLMGEHAPTNPERRKLQTPRRTDGPYDRPAHITGADDLFDSDTSESESDSDADPPPPPVRQLRSGVIDPSTRTAEGAHNNDGLSAEIGDGDVVSMDHTSYLTGKGMEMDDAYAPLHDQRGNNMFDAEGDDEEPGGAKDVATGDTEHDYETMPQPTTTSRPLRMYDPQRQHVMDSPRSASETDVTPAKHGKGRPPKQSIGKPTPIPVSAAPAPPGKTNPSAIHQAQNLSVVSAVPAVAPATTSATLALAPPTTAAAPIANPMPQLVLRTEEAEANRTALSTLDQYNVAAKIYKELLEARTENRPMPESLTGLPPSAKEVDAAKRKLKEATQAMMLALD